MLQGLGQGQLHGLKVAVCLLFQVQSLWCQSTWQSPQGTLSTRPLRLCNASHTAQGWGPLSEGGVILLTCHGILILKKVGGIPHICSVLPWRCK